MRGPGIEPGSLRWQRNILPINYPRIKFMNYQNLKTFRYAKLKEGPHWKQTPQFFGMLLSWLL